MARERYVDVDGTKYFRDDIQKMSAAEIKMLCSFIGNRNDLLFVQSSTDNELAQVSIDNLLAIT